MAISSVPAPLASHRRKVEHMAPRLEGQGILHRCECHGVGEVVSRVHLADPCAQTSGGGPSQGGGDLLVRLRGRGRLGAILQVQRLLPRPHLQRRRHLRQPCQRLRKNSDAILHS